MSSFNRIFRLVCIRRREIWRGHTFYSSNTASTCTRSSNNHLFFSLVINEIPKHPEYQPNSDEVRRLRSSCVTALDICEQTKPIILAQYMEKLESSKRMAQRLKETSESAARTAYERSLEAQKMEEARAVRMREIQLMEAQRTYELQKEKERRASVPAIQLEDDLDYLSLVPDHKLATPTTPPEKPREASVAPVSPGPKFYSEGGALLRSLMIPSSIVKTFLEIAAANTRRNVETCGVLAGKLSQNRFTITHLIVPKQEGTSDTCSMVGEEDVLGVQDKLDLLTLGWIHTHPTQQCFLSSVDLHTHFPYQLMMAEAIAIVVAPTQTPNYGVFRLTDPPGLAVIADCPARGFHPHHCDQPIYSSLGGPNSHAQFDNCHLEVIDLR